MARLKFHPVIAIIDFHHARGPEVEEWIGVEDDGIKSEWPLLPFMALSDGAHSSEEDFSYFTLRHLPSTDDEISTQPVSLFGISCTRQLDAASLIDKPADVTRSTVQKAVVVIAESPVYFGTLKEKLGMVTRAWFAQKNFEDLDIIKKFQESLKVSLSDNDTDREQYLGLSLRELVFEFRQQTLVLFKCCLLQPKMLFFASRCDRLCMTQFSLLSLIPGLLRCLEDCADPEFNFYEQRLTKPTSVRTSDRRSLLAFMGMPLQIFGKGSLFGPYTPLQQLDLLADVGTKSYVVGSTNSLLLQQRDRYSDILINLDEQTINIYSTSLKAGLSLTAADRRWIDSIVQSVLETWDENDPSRPKSMGFVGSEEYIRLQFEEYILAMVSSVKCHDFLEKHAGSSSRILPDVDGDPILDFGSDFIEMWKRTENYRIFEKFTDSELFDLVPPKHVMAGGLSMEDVSRRISQQLNDFKLDEKVTVGKEAVARTFVAGKGKIGAAFFALGNNVAQLRDVQVKKAGQQPEPNSPSVSTTPSIESSEVSSTEKQSEQQVRQGYFSSWASWAGEKRKKGIFTAASPEASAASPTLQSFKEGQNSGIGSKFDDVHRPESEKSLSDKHASNSTFDAETGIAKGDSGSISLPSRESMESDSGEQDVQAGQAQPKGLISRLSERFIDTRKSLPPPPPPEKELSYPATDRDGSDRSDQKEDTEFLRNLRKSLPPPPSEIDNFPMLVTPGPAPGPLIAQEIDISPIEPKSTSRTVSEVSLSPKVSDDNKPDIGKDTEPDSLKNAYSTMDITADNDKPSFTTSSTEILFSKSQSASVMQEDHNKSMFPKRSNDSSEISADIARPLSPASRSSQKYDTVDTTSSVLPITRDINSSESTTTLPDSQTSKTTRLKARHLIQKYVAQEKVVTSQSDRELSSASVKVLGYPAEAKQQSVINTACSADNPTADASSAVAPAEGKVSAPVEPAAAAAAAAEDMSKAEARPTKRISVLPAAEDVLKVPKRKSTVSAAPSSQLMDSETEPLSTTQADGAENPELRRYINKRRSTFKSPPEETEIKSSETFESPLRARRKSMISRSPDVSDSPLSGARLASPHRIVADEKKAHRSSSSKSNFDRADELQTSNHRSSSAKTTSPIRARDTTRARSGTMMDGPSGVEGTGVASNVSPGSMLFASKGPSSPRSSADLVQPVSRSRGRSPTIATKMNFNAPLGDNNPLSPGRIAQAESRLGPGRIGGGLKDNPFLKKDAEASTGNADPITRKRVGTLKNNPFIKNDIKSPPNGAQ